MWARTKTWAINKCWDMFSMDQIEKKSRVFAMFVALSFFLSVVAIIGLVLAFLDIHIWSKSGDGQVIMVPTDNLVYLNGQTFIPIVLK